MKLQMNLKETVAARNLMQVICNERISIEMGEESDISAKVTTTPLGLTFELKPSVFIKILEILAKNPGIIMQISQAYESVFEDPQNKEQIEAMINEYVEFYDQSEDLPW